MLRFKFDSKEKAEDAFDKILHNFELDAALKNHEPKFRIDKKLLADFSIFEIYFVKFKIAFSLDKDIIETTLYIKKPCTFTRVCEVKSFNYVCLPLKYGAIQCE